MKSFWTEEKIEKLKNLIRNGFTHRQCSEILETTKNAIIGKCTRLGIEYPASTRPKTKTKVVPIRKRIPTKYFIKDNREINFESNDEPKRLNKSLLDLEDGDCRYPYDHEDGKTFVFCANSAVNGSSYCQYHHHKCFNGPKKGKGYFVMKKRVAKVAA